jgi:hypothetical protein
MRSLVILSAALLSVGSLAAGQGPQPKPVAKKSSASSTKAATPTKPVDQSPRPIYAELTITELIGEDANRWSNKMDTRAAVSGFVTQVAKGDDGDTEIRICENPKIDGMDRAHCIVAKCIPKLPCDVPRLGKPITVKGITQYDAKVGTHWWEIHPVEEIEK